MSNNAFYIFKGIHMLVQSLTVAMSVWLTYQYSRKTRDAQMVMFILLAAHNVRMLHMELYNDTFVGFYSILAITLL